MTLRVNVLCEDRTGSGLQTVITKATNARRSDQRKPPLVFPRKHSTIAGNTKLLEQCRKYSRLRFRTRPRYDHVVYVIDAYRLWELPQIDVQVPDPNEDLDAYLERLTTSACRVMTDLAREGRTDEGGGDIAGGFHAHVLVWERESLMLPVSDALGLGPPPDDPCVIRHPAGWVKQRMRAHGKENYDKAVHGPELLETIASSRELREAVLAALPSLEAIVSELTAL